ncbi:hypothetical protein F7725_021344 [Dissostichus mawsoni]|uniref:Uncharacterized protein n=1 Tax=Dissostichus mawsoni TaxID=36200 RepID=A0A7J5YFR6_DISMA|nr:hypothetical protein F7725_021344 [Dissostichus mawsoni]
MDFPGFSVTSCWSFLASRSSGGLSAAESSMRPSRKQAEKCSWRRKEAGRRSHAQSITLRRWYGLRAFGRESSLMRIALHAWYACMRLEEMHFFSCTWR